MVLIAIDGPSGSGKSTLASALARRLGLERLDTGSMYRVVALAALWNDVDLDDEGALGNLATSIDLKPGEVVELNGVDVTDAIRSAKVSAAASKVATAPPVRAELVRRQREWIAQHGGGVVEGRDIASVVAPDADVKVFLMADLDERGRRRAAQIRESGSDHDLADHDVATVRTTMVERDARDETRAVSPLVITPGALIIDSTHRSVDDIVDEVVGKL